MDKDRCEVRIPHISVILETSSTEEDARVAAEDIILNKFNIDNFEILRIELISEGVLKTKEGPKEGKRYCVAFRELHESVVFLHADFEKIMENAANFNWSMIELDHQMNDVKMAKDGRLRVCFRGKIMKKLEQELCRLGCSNELEREAASA